MSDKSEKRTILLVDDEKSVLLLFETVLERAGYEVLTASNGKEALDVEMNFEGPIHLLLTDLRMPVMKGWQLSEQILARRPEIAVLYMSAYDESIIDLSTSTVPSWQLLEKPFTNAQLLDKVGAAFDTPIRPYEHYD